jgi:hypothetical protein
LGSVVLGGPRRTNVIVGQVRLGVHSQANTLHSICLVILEKGLVLGHKHGAESNSLTNDQFGSSMGRHVHVLNEDSAVACLIISSKSAERHCDDVLLTFKLNDEA